MKKEKTEKTQTSRNSSRFSKTIGVSISLAMSVISTLQVQDDCVRVLDDSLQVLNDSLRV